MIKEYLDSFYENILRQNSPSQLSVISQDPTTLKKTDFWNIRPFCIEPIPEQGLY